MFALEGIGTERIADSRTPIGFSPFGIGNSIVDPCIPQDHPVIWMLNDANCGWHSDRSGWCERDQLVFIGMERSCINDGKAQACHFHSPLLRRSRLSACGRWRYSCSITKCSLTNRHSWLAANGYSGLV